MNACREKSLEMLTVGDVISDFWLLTGKGVSDFPIKRQRQRIRREGSKKLNHPPIIAQRTLFLSTGTVGR